MVEEDIYRIDFWNCETVGYKIYRAWDYFLPHLPNHIEYWKKHGIQWGLYPENAYWLWIPILMSFFYAGLRLALKSVMMKAAARLVKSPTKRQKLVYQLWLLMYYTSYTCAGFAVLSNLPWWGAPVSCKASRLMWEPQSLMQDAPPGILFSVYYLTQCGFYLEELWATIREPHRKDFIEYLIHHTVTIVLIILSWVTSHQRIGSLVFILHDIPDIFLCVAKIFHYLKLQLPTDATFIVFMLSFALCRLYLFPGLIWSAFAIGMPNYTPLVFNWVLPLVLLFGLLPLHIYWFYLILRMAYRALVVKKIETDIRSDSDSDEDEPKKSQ